MPRIIDHPLSHELLVAVATGQTVQLITEDDVAHKVRIKDIKPGDQCLLIVGDECGTNDFIATLNPVI